MQNKLNVKIMGILNVTPNSFSDGGKFFDAAKAVGRARQMIKEGADIIDIGGESTGPGSKYVSLKEELRRVIPVIMSLLASRLHAGHGGSQSKQSRYIISIDTYKAEVAIKAIKAGAAMVNDVTALRGDPKMASVIAETGVSVVLMYSKDKTARTTRTKKQYRDVVKTISEFLEKRIEYSLENGIKKKQIIIDPGMGAFVSNEPKYSYEILARLKEFKKLGYPILVGVSRKSFLPGKTKERLSPTLAANTIAILNGVNIIRVHDVVEHRKLFIA